jgi:photosystem II stability/assembly factor-like uncharacterized protein
MFVGSSIGIFRSSDNGDSWTQGTTNRAYAIATNRSGDIVVGTLQRIIRSTDNGDTWTEVNDHLTDGYIRTVALNSSGHIFVAATAKHDGVGGGVFRSTDNGVSWIELDLGLTDKYFRTLAVSSTDDIFVGTFEGVFRSVNNGDNWTQVNNGLRPASVDAIAFDTSGDVFAGTNVGIFLSSDNGENWTEKNDGLRVTTVLTIALNSSDEIFAGTAKYGVSRSSDNGQSWIKINNGLTNTIVSALAINAGGDIFAGTVGDGIFRSTDDGDHWTQINSGLTEVNIRTIAINSAGDIFAGAWGGSPFGSDGVVFRSSDNGDTWMEVNTGLAGNIVEDFAFNSSGHIFAGTYRSSVEPMGDLFRSTDNGGTWTKAGSHLSGTVSGVVVNSSDVVFSVMFYGGVYRSADNGETWTEVSDGLPNGASYGVLGIDSLGYLFLGRRLGGGMFLSADEGDSWTRFSDGLFNGCVNVIAANSHNDLFVGTAGDGVFRLMYQTAIDISCDIKPGSCPNPLNAIGRGRGKAVLPVAILGGDDFDVREIDPETVALNGVNPLRWSYEDVSTPVDKSQDRCACSEDGADGFEDLTLKFDRQAIVSSLNTASIGQRGAIVAYAIKSALSGNSFGDNSSYGSPPLQDKYVLRVEGHLKDGTDFEGYDCVVLMTKGEAAAVVLNETQRAPELIGNHPNPFNPVTKISFYLPEATHVKLDIHNVLGQSIARLVDGVTEAGEHVLAWDGSGVASGVYFYRLEVGDYSESRKMILLK